MRERVRATMARAFAVAPESLPDDPAFDNVPEWDSLRHLELMMELELEFGVRISSAAMFDAVSIEAIEDELRRQGVQ